MDLTAAFHELAIALGLGLLVGLQRQRVGPEIAGLRTFGLVALLGAACAQLAGTVGPWLVVAGLVALTALVVAGNFLGDEEKGSGQTTEVAVLLMYVVGAYVVLGSRELAIVMGASVAVLLYMKAQLHGIVERIGDADFRAIMRFAVISLIVLPVLPNQTYGPYQVLNPRQIWWMVVLIVGINLAGYAGYRLLGRRRGTLLAGILGGLISSTATTASYARGSESNEESVRRAATVIFIASSVVFARVLVEISAVAPGFLPVAVGPILTIAGVATLLCLIALRTGKGGDELPVQSNPSELGPALFFAVVYGLVLLAVAVGQDFFGGAGIYGVAIMSGLTDMDAITLSTSQLVKAGRLDPSVGWRAIVLASISNLAFKTGIVAVVGSRPLLGRLAMMFGVLAVVAAAVMFFWT